MGKGNNKEYYCCICHKKLDYKPIRLTKQIHDNKECYGRYNKVHNYDFCKEHYEVFNKWVKKYERAKNERT